MSATPHGLAANDAAHPHNRFHVVLTSVIAALAGLLFGLDIGVISGALPFIARQFHINDQGQEWIVSSMMVGAAFGALGSGWMAKAIGRKYSLMIGAALFACASGLCAFAWSPAVLIIGRVFLGLAVGIASFTAPLYLSEIAPTTMRGAMISLHQLMVTVGILAAFISNTAFSGAGDWRWMLGVIAFPAIALLIGLLFLPRSPRWLMSRGRDAEAAKVLERLRSDSNAVATEMREIAEQLKVEFQGWGLFRSNPNFRRSVWLGVLLQVMQQLTGINVVMYYAPRIFGLAGYGTAHDQLWGTVIVGAVNVAATFIAIGLVDRWGRKPILYGFYGDGSRPRHARRALARGRDKRCKPDVCRGDAAGVYRRLRDVRRADDLDSLCGNPAHQRTRFRHCGFDLRQLGRQYHRWRDLSDLAQHAWSRANFLALRRDECCVRVADAVADTGNKGGFTRADRTQSDGRAGAAAARRLDQLFALLVSFDPPARLTEPAR